MKGRAWLVALAVLALLGVVMYTQITVLVQQPIKAMPEGKTLVMLRLANTQFIDSADAICEREMGGVSLLCRISALAAISENATILFRMPYSTVLYEISTGGKHYAR
jgi:hypothetical protein